MSAFWNKELEEAWKVRQKAEKAYTSFKCANTSLDKQTKNRLRLDFKYLQDVFDKKFRFYKRKYHNQRYNKLEETVDPANIWKQLNSLVYKKASRTFEELLKEDGT